ncbi:MAG: YbbR-like domain-containing protein [Christensenellales bacterium]|jgi:YbbR domain-containing protein
MKNKLLAVWERLKGIVLHFFDDSFHLRLLSIFFAVIIWASVISGDDATWQINETNIPVYVIGAEDLEARGLALKQDVDDLVADTLKSVSVQLEGTKSAITGLNSSNLRAVLDLSQILREGKGQQVHLVIQGAGNLGIKRISPADYITLDVESLYTDDNLPVTVVFTGSLPEGYIRPSDERSVLPSKISISGTASDVQAIKHAYVEVDLTNATSSINQQYNFVLTDENFNPIDAPTVKVSTPTVIVRSNIYKTKTVPIQWLGSFVGEVFPGYVLGDITMIPDEVTIAGSPEDIENIYYVYVNSIDLSGAFESFSQQVELVVQNGVKWMSFSSAEILVDITEELSTTVIANVPIEYKNQPEGVIVELETDVVTVAAEGPASFISRLNRGDVKAYVNLISMTEGEYFADIEFELIGEDVPENVSFSRASVGLIITPTEETEE